jgi:hypothetical protein
MNAGTLNCMQWWCFSASRRSQRPSRVLGKRRQRMAIVTSDPSPLKAVWNLKPVEYRGRYFILADRKSPCTFGGDMMCDAERRAMKHCSWIAVATCLIFGCTSHRTGIIPVGRDTFTVDEPVAVFAGGTGSYEGAKRVALTEANAYCQKNGKQVLVTNMGPEAGSYETIFRCLAADDPALKRPNFEPVPGIVIEQRNQWAIKPPCLPSVSGYRASMWIERRPAAVIAARNAKRIARAQRKLAIEHARYLFQRALDPLLSLPAPEGFTEEQAAIFRSEIFRRYTACLPPKPRARTRASHTRV